jgi:hypothetical protein
MSAKRTAIAAALLAVVVAGQLTYFRSTYAGLLTADFGQDQTFKIANVARTATPPGTSLIVIGTDWSSVVPYYAQRKAFAVPNWLPLASWRRILAAPQSFLDGVPMGGVVYCPDNLWPNAEREALVASFIAGRAIRGEVGPCKVLAPAKS